ncbi:MAG: response regulator transcription factor [Bacteroidia bacterium]
MIKVVIADDHKMFAEGLAALLSTSDNISILGTVQNGKELVAYLQEQMADVVLLDIDMPELNGEESLHILQKMWPELKVVILTMHDEPSYINQFVSIGANGYVLKNTGRDELVKAVQSVYAGGDFFSYDVINRMKNFKDVAVEKNEETGIEFTEREFEIVKLTAKLLTVKEISAELFISVNTVKTHRKNIQKKIGVTSSNGITKYAIEHGWV